MIDDPRRAALVAIGDELVTGETLDTNSAWLSERLADIGIEVVRFTLLGDDERALERTFYELCNEFQIVIATGGLGPTLDDVTRHAAARAAGEPLELVPEVEDGLRERWAATGREMPAANLRQALFPRGAQVIPNDFGTAPGFRVWIAGGCLACLPGPPREMRPMAEQELLPWIVRTCGVTHVRRTARFFLYGLPESQFAELAGDWMDRVVTPRLGVCASGGVLTARLWVEASGDEQAECLLAPRRAELRERFGRWLFSETDPDLARVLGAELIRRQLSIAVAESCTGGLVAARLTELPGISAAFREGWVTYTDAAKTARLGVPEELLEAHGAVSAEVAEAMAVGAAERSGARIALAITGIAGPGGGTAEKPVGLVWFGLCVDGRSRAVERRFPAVGRDLVRQFAANMALDLVFRELPEA